MTWCGFGFAIAMGSACTRMGISESVGGVKVQGKVRDLGEDVQ